jgi:competence protein ComEC
MGILYAWAIYLGRQSTAVISLFASGMTMTAIDPLTLWDVGFQFSFAATLGLILFTPRFTTRVTRSAGRLLPAWPGLRRTLLAFVGDTVIVTLAAQVLVLPLVAHRFGRLSVVSPVANLLVLPVQPAIMVWGGLAVMVGLVSEVLVSAGLAGAAAPFWWVARGTALVPWATLHWTASVVEALAPLPFASRQLDVGPGALLAFYGVIAGVLASDRPTLPLLGSLLHRVRAVLASSAAISSTAALLLLSCYLLPAVLRSQPDGQLHVHFLDVDRGEAILIVTPDGQQVLVDGGYDPEALAYALGRHMPFYDRQIELVVVTSPGDERVRGLAGLPERYQIQHVLQAPFPYPSAAYETWLRALQADAVPVTAAEAGLRVHLGYGIALDVLHPGAAPALASDGQLDPAANSLVLRLSYGATSFLLLGDAPRTVQEQLVAAGLIQPATVIKLPGSGRQAWHSHRLMAAAHPQHAVVFVQADERYRHLSPAVQDAWA